MNFYRKICVVISNFKSPKISRINVSKKVKNLYKFKFLPSTKKKRDQTLRIKVLKNRMVLENLEIHRKYIFYGMRNTL